MPRNRRVLALVLAVVVLVAAVAVVAVVAHNGKSNKGANPPISTTPVAGLTSAKFGVSTGVQLFTEQVGEIDKDVAGIAALHAHWIRTAVRWDLVEPDSPNSDDWTKSDRIVNDATAHHLSIILNITGTPKWARAPGAGNVQFPPDLHTYATFTGKIAARYKGKVAAYELGNEPNHVKSFAHPDPKLYEEVLQYSYPLIKASDPNTMVLTGGLGGNKVKGGLLTGNQFLAALYKDGAKPYFDAVSYHPYTYPDLPSTANNKKKPGWANMLSARQVMVANGDGAKQIWVTEDGAPTGGPGSVSQAQQAAIMHDAYRLWATYSWGGPLCWFDYRDKGTDTSDHGDFFGLYTKDGQPKLALQQYETLVRAAK